MDNGEPAPKAFAAPQPQLLRLIIEGVLGGSLEWGLVVTGVLIAVAVELMRRVGAAVRRGHVPAA